MFDNMELSVVKYCSEEVERQQDGPIEVFHLVNAWSYAVFTSYRSFLNLEIIERVGVIVKPDMNQGGFRKTQVWVGNRECPDAVKAMALLFRFEQLLAGVQDFDIEAEKEMINWAENIAKEIGADGELIKDAPDAAYLIFEYIHPFSDGNGRTGKIVYNWLKKTLEHPELPPDFFGIPNL